MSVQLSPLCDSVPSMTTATPDLIEAADTDVYTYEPGDSEKFSHYVPKNEILRAAWDGIPARAICGKTWVPTRDGERFPLCPDCKALYDAPWRRDQ